MVTRQIAKRMVCEVAPDSATCVVDLIYGEACALGPRPALYCKHYCCHIANVIQPWCGQVAPFTTPRPEKVMVISGAKEKGSGEISFINSMSLNGVVPHVPYSPGTTPPSQWAPFGPLPLQPRDNCYKENKRGCTTPVPCDTRINAQ